MPIGTFGVRRDEGGDSDRDRTLPSFVTGPASGTSTSPGERAPGEALEAGLPGITGPDTNVDINTPTTISPTTSTVDFSNLFSGLFSGGVGISNPFNAQPATTDPGTGGQTDIPTFNELESDFAAVIHQQSLEDILGDQSDFLGMSGEDIAAFFKFDSSAGDFFDPINQNLLQASLDKIKRRQTFGLAAAGNREALGLSGAATRLSAERESGQESLLSLRLQQQSRGRGFGQGGPVDRLQRAATGQVTDRFGRASSASLLQREGIRATGVEGRFSTQEAASQELEGLIGDISSQIADIYNTAAGLRADDFKTAGSGGGQSDRDKFFDDNLGATEEDYESFVRDRQEEFS